MPRRRIGNPPVDNPPLCDNTSCKANIREKGLYMTLNFNIDEYLPPTRFCTRECFRQWIQTVNRLINEGKEEELKQILPTKD